MFNEEATHSNFIVFGLTKSGLEHTIYHTRGGKKSFEIGTSNLNINSALQRSKGTPRMVDRHRLILCL
jgi:hypothetical protein